MLALLLGNTTLRFACLRDELLRGDVLSQNSPPMRIESRRIAWEDLRAQREVVRREWRAAAGQGVIAASVRDDRVELVEALLPPGTGLVLAGRDFEVPVRNRTDAPQQVGVDRLLNVLAARRRAGGRAAIVVDFGTTVSISAMSAEGDFIGGAIALGVPAARHGLSAGTPRLPRLELAAESSHVGRTTETALSRGVYWQLAGGTQELLRGLSRELMLSDPLVLATGGDAELFAAAVDSIDEVVPELTFEGLVLAHRTRPDVASR